MMIFVCDLQIYEVNVYHEEGVGVELWPSLFTETVSSKEG